MCIRRQESIGKSQQEESLPLSVHQEKALRLTGAKVELRAHLLCGMSFRQDLGLLVVLGTNLLVTHTMGSKQSLSVADTASVEFNARVLACLVVWGVNLLVCLYFDGLNGIRALLKFCEPALLEYALG